MLLRGKSNLVVAENVRTGRMAGKSENEAVQAAFAHAKKTSKKPKKKKMSPDCDGDGGEDYQG